MFSLRVSSIKKLLFYISAILVPLYFTDFRFPTGGVIIRLSDVLALTLILSSSFLVMSKRMIISYPPGFNFILLFLCYCFFNAFLQSGIVKALIATFQWFMIITSLVFVYSNALSDPKKFRELFIKALLTICALTFLYHITHGHLVSYKFLGDAKYSFALTGVFLLSYAYHLKDKKYLKPLIFLYPIILLSLERKGILAFHMVALFYIFISMKNIERLILCACISFCALASIVFLDLSFINNFTIFEYSDFDMLYLNEEQALWVSNLHRQSLLTNGWDIFTNNYVFGVGPKMLPNYMGDYYINQGLALYTHNVFLDTLIEQGIIGLLLLLLPYFMYLLKTSSNKIEGNRIIFYAFCIYSTFMIFFMSGGAPSMVLFYLPLFKGFISKNEAS
ncbi:hypothetical protein F0Z19_1176 [Vibrio cyclitrophicus]|nr:hypothetical protein F0Z19_1176 [Vibrio cyclitrophicus]